MNLQPIKIKDISKNQLQLIMKRSMQDISSIYEYVKNIVDDVKNQGDKAIIKGLKSFGYKESIDIEDIKVDKTDIEDAYTKVSKEVVNDIKAAANNIKKFHEAQLEKQMWCIEIIDGIIVGRITRAIENVGCYVPGGTAAYPSTVLMTVIPAKVAGVKNIILTTPPMKEMSINPLVLIAADIAGVDKIFKVGGPWGIAGLAFGTETIPKVDKIVGPGNKYVTAAKMVVYGIVDIDSPAGPSESLILADETGNPEWIAVDFLSQIEHDPDSSAILITTKFDLANKVCNIINKRYETLSRKEIFRSSLFKYSHVLIADDIDEAINFINEYAPEHLQIVTKDVFVVLNKIKHAGSIFLGPYAPVPVGDYASGTNHVLPTAKGARMFSGLSVDDFIKKPTFQYLSKKGLESLKDVVIRLAEQEGLPIHAESIKVRF